jgi:DNA-binding XRE family transcriptional regulator
VKAIDGRNRVRAARQLLGLTQSDLSVAVGITQSSLSDLERQRYGGTTVDTARKFADLFGCSIEDLFPARAEVAS